VRHAAAPAGQDSGRIGGAVREAERHGQVPGVQVPFRASCASHARHGHHDVPVLVMRQVPDWRQPARVGARGNAEGSNVLGRRRVGQGG
jgi:hypothetical protein